ncbi:hypothetical protein C493_00650 [Natronolimnohabitans innermongolicus JCM 12255]|uniref:Uncharacterized protein n=1 Tax=Natronolimnohabitans innermongolicus JCM 12255 TaxID=1227499 RepID=L9XKL8_9EURY|nr:hypothetical protein C493_00650 [Natronolimnohabitans innermongolicus JCM 12255]
MERTSFDQPWCRGRTVGIRRDASLDGDATPPLSLDETSAGLATQGIRQRAAICRVMCGRLPHIVAQPPCRRLDNDAPGTGAEWIGPANGYR